MSSGAESFYDEYGEEEWKRLEKNFVHSLEFENTVPYLEEHLPDEGKILDAGGASGRYAIWLAKKGYEVTLIDISEKQLSIAKEKIEEKCLEDRIEVEKGDIRDLDFVNDEFDAVISLGGPLSHVLEEEGRNKAVSEFSRVAKPEAPVMVSVMSFHGVLLLQSRMQWGFIEEIQDFYRRQKYDEKLRKKMGEKEPSFADTYFFRRNQLESLIQENGMEVQKVLGLENIASIWDKNFKELDEEYKEDLKKASKLLREDEASPDISNHMLAVARN